MLGGIGRLGISGMSFPRFVPAHRWSLERFGGILEGTELESPNSAVLRPQLLLELWVCLEIWVKDGKKQELWGWNEARHQQDQLGLEQPGPVPKPVPPVPVRVTPGSRERGIRATSQGLDGNEERKRE